MKKKRGKLLFFFFNYTMRRIFNHGTDIMGFGKHHSMMLSEVVTYDPEYVLWMHKKCRNISVPKKYVNAARAQAANKKIGRAYYNVCISANRIFPIC